MAEERLSSRFPYEAHSEQRKAMLAIRDGLVNGGVTIIESPTGTGKTLMLLTACLDYLVHSGGDGDEDDHGEPEWIRRHRQEMMMMNQASLDNGRRVKRKMHVDTDSNIHRLLSILPDSSDSEQGNGGGETVSDYLESLTITRPPIKKLIYASRTHSQLKQVLGELEKVNHERLKAVIVGGRAQLCINDTINNNHQHGDLADKCADLLTSEHGCPYWHQERSVGNVKELVSRLSGLVVVDIEEARTSGRQCRACPYYTMKTIQQQAQILLCPYPSLFARDGAMAGVVDENTIVVIDEAHNLQDYINQSQTKLLSHDTVKMVVGAIQRYIGKYGRRLNGLNLASVQQLQFVLANICNYLETMTAHKTRDERLDSGGESMAVLQFMQKCSIDTVNLVKLVEYCRDCRLAYKLDYTDDGNTDKSSSHHLLFECVEFLEKLSEDSINGRIIVSTSEEGRDEMASAKYVNVKASAVMEPIVANSKAVILAGGTMSPISDQIDGLFPTCSVTHHSFAHIISPDRYGVTVLGSGPNRHRIDCRWENRADQAMWTDIGSAIVNLARVSPGSVCVFFASHPLLQQALSMMSHSVMQLRQSRPLFVEEKERGAAGVDGMLKDFSKTPKACLFAVIGGRISEGVNLRDDLCRLLIVVGLPYLNEKDAEVAERVRHGGGSRFVHNQCMRKVNQTIGRALRHAHDYAHIVLLDGRFEQVMRDLPSWMQGSVVVAPSFPAAYTRAVQFFKKQLSTPDDRLGGAVEGRSDAVGPR